jgi:5-methylcytosine-specific restriction endonuclease McrA
MSDTYKRHFQPLLRRQQNHCHYCNCHVSRRHPVGHPQKATLDHRTPRCRGGSNMRQNLVVACESCNSRKGAMTEVEFRWLLTQGRPLNISIISTLCA